MRCRFICFLSLFRSAVVLSLLLLLLLLPKSIAAYSEEQLPGTAPLSALAGEQFSLAASVLPKRHMPTEFFQSPVQDPPVQDAADIISAADDTLAPAVNLPPYRQGAAEVSQNRETIEALATDQSPGILLAASIANQGNTYQRPLGVDWVERVQVVLGLGGDPSVGIGQIMPEEAKGYGYKGDVWGLFDDETSIRLMAVKLQRTEQAVETLHLDPTESFILVAIGNNIGDAVVTAPNRFRQYGTIRGFLENDEEARTQLLKMMKWMIYLQASEGWSFPEDVDTNRIWQLLWNVYG